MLDWLYRGLGILLSWLSINDYYVLGLLFYALIFKIVFLPFAIKQQKNQIKMAKLTPKIELIKAKYKGRNDQPTMQKQQQEIMELQQKEGYSPMSGCLPLLIQLPLIMLLYTVIRNPMSHIANVTSTVEDYNNDIKNGETIDIEGKYAILYKTYAKKIDAGFPIEREDIVGVLRYDFRNDLSKVEEKDALGENEEIQLVSNIYKRLHNEDGSRNELAISAFELKYGIEYDSIPNFNLFGIKNADLAQKPSFTSWLAVIPFLAAAAQWLSMFLTRRLNKTGLEGPQDRQQKTSMRIMDLAMPLMTVFMAFVMPAMLGLYWVYQSLLGLLQSFVLAKVMPLPKYTEEDIKALRREAKEVEKAHKAAVKAQPKHKSLHYIDEEDYEELPVVNAQEPAESNEPKADPSDAPEIKD